MRGVVGEVGRVVATRGHLTQTVAQRAARLNHDHLTRKLISNLLYLCINEEDTQCSDQLSFSLLDPKYHN